LSETFLWTAHLKMRGEMGRLNCPMPQTQIRRYKRMTDTDETVQRIAEIYDADVRYCPGCYRTWDWDCDECYDCGIRTERVGDIND